jgi:hypothetical protein
MRWWTVVAGVMGLACAGTGTGDGDIPDGSDDPDPSDAAATPAPPSSNKLPDIRGGLERGGCDDGPGNEGADSHFVGDIHINGSTVSGSESWVLFANPKWKAKGGGDCEVTWRLTGRTGATGACSDCDLGIVIKAQPDVEGSGCPKDLVKREARAFDTEYAIKRTKDGVAWVYWAKSGKLLGQGYHSRDHLNYASQHQCKWF